MRRVAVLMSAFAVVLWTVSAFAQAKPNFAGSWTREAPAGGAAAGGGGGGGGRGGGGGGGGWGAECTLTQTATDLTVEYMGGGQTPAPIKLVYKLDGTDSKNMMAGRGGAAPTEVVSKASWDGAKLVIKTTQTMQAGPVEVVQTVSLDAGKLKIDRTAPGRDGAPATTSVTYAKKM